MLRAVIGGYPRSIKVNLKIGQSQGKFVIFCLFVCLFVLSNMIRSFGKVCEIN